MMSGYNIIGAIAEGTLSLTMIAVMGILLSQQAIAEKMKSPQMMASLSTIGAIAVRLPRLEMIADQRGRPLMMSSQDMIGAIAVDSRSSLMIAGLAE
jgi:hypothetical protein